MGSIRQFRARRRFFGVLVVGLLAAYGAFPAHASGGVVTDCSNDSQLNSLIATGGTISFNCGPGPHTIPISGQKSINADTSIDGGGTITLDAQNQFRIFDVGATLTLRGLVLTRAFFNGDGGAIRNTSNGTLVLESSTIRNSHATLSGGAILSLGPLTIRDSLLEGNTALNGGALYPRFAGANTTIINSVLRNNKATDSTDGWGGAILAWDGAPVTIDGGEIAGNTATSGGAIYNFANSVLTIKNGTQLRKNITDKWGAIYNDGTVTITDATFSGNKSFYCGGGIFNFGAGVATLTDVTLDGNFSSEGGGICNSGGTLTLANDTFSNNTADFTGGGLYNVSGNSTITNVTFSSNSAVDSGGGVYQTAGGTTALTNVTLSGNSAPKGGGIFRDNRYQGTVTVKNSIVTNSPQGGNCAGVITSNGYNLATDNTCGFTQVANVRLGPLANNGGPTRTFLPMPGSPAIDFVITGCPPPSTDQRGAARPIGSLCDAGAVEFGASLPMLYVPLAKK